MRRHGSPRSRTTRALARGHGARVTARLPLIHGLSLRLPGAQATRLAHTRAVKSVTLNSRVKAQAVSAANLASTFPKTIAADKLWNLATAVTGKGVGVAVIDTGVAGDLPDFRNPDGSSCVVANVVTNAAALSPADGF